jgi:RsiW-degrading membrane proteinase PrsW (M82 family)
MAFLGVASLAGLIISHVIVLFDFIEEMRHKGEPLVQIAGMLVATVVTLVLVPVLYVIFVEDLHLVRWEQDSPDHAPPSESLKASDTITKPVLVHS